MLSATCIQNRFWHNDIKAVNGVIAKDVVKLIDFGKATLYSNPVVYNVVPGSDICKKYNTTQYIVI